jgi:hypothetical protein
MSALRARDAKERGEIDLARKLAGEAHRTIIEVLSKAWPGGSISTTQVALAWADVGDGVLNASVEIDPTLNQSAIPQAANWDALIANLEAARRATGPGTDFNCADAAAS